MIHIVALFIIVKNSDKLMQFQITYQKILANKNKTLEFLSAFLVRKN